MLIDRRLLRNLDLTVVITVLLLVLYGLAMVYSATRMIQGTAVVQKQLYGVLLGFIGMTLIILFDYHASDRMHYLLYVGNILMLTAVLLMGREVHGAKSWLPLGPLSFQPAEFAKIAVILTLARHLAHKEHIDSFWDLLGPLFHVGIPLVLILLQPDLGSALVFVFIAFAMLYMAGARLLHLLIIGVIPILIVSANLLAYHYIDKDIPLVIKEYQLRRLTVFLDPESDPKGAGYNLTQAKIAIGSGQFIGKGYLKGSQGRLGYVPEAETDFIFAIVGEELGFIGSFVLLSLFFTLIWRGLRIAFQAKDKYGSLLATGVLAMFLFHVMENIGMNIGIMPITGIPLPFISSGATSMTASLWAVGILENVWARRQKIMF